MQVILSVLVLLLVVCLHFLNGRLFPHICHLLWGLVKCVLLPFEM